MAKRILIVYASTGGGHRSAAIAVQKTLQNGLSLNVTSVRNFLNFTDRKVKTGYELGYLVLSNKFPALWKLLYKSTYTNRSFGQEIGAKLIEITNKVFFARFRSYLKKENFDLIVSTHFLASEVVGKAIQQSIISSKLITVITDFDVHPSWLNSHTETYVVASEYTKGILQKEPHQKCIVSGIPVDPHFICNQPKGDARTIDEGLKILVCYGESGGLKVTDIVKNVVDLPIELTVVCGKNKKLYSYLKNNFKNPNLKIIGYVTNLYDYMKTCDLLITKPGGLTVSEAINCKKPMIFFGAIPGQEMGNINVLRHYGIGSINLDGQGVRSSILKLLNQSKKQFCFFDSSVYSLLSYKCNNLSACLAEMSNK